MKLFFKIATLLILILAVSLIFSPKPSLLTNQHFSTAIYDDHQRLLRLTLSADDKYRLYTPLNTIPNNIIATTLLQEDQYFYKHIGINPFALTKAICQTYLFKSRRMGASTISMQVARMHFKIYSKTLTGKLLQIWYALVLERHFTKSQIIEAYLNLAPYGGNIEGIGAASLIYFNNSIEKLTLPQALTLAVIPQNPSRRKPPSEELKNSRQRLFERWLQLHQEDKSFIPALQLPLTTRTTHDLPYIAPHFVNALLTNHLPQSVHTTLNKSLQTIIERVVKQYVQHKKNIGVNNAAVLLVDTRDMSIKSLLGSADFFNTNIQGQVNFIEAKRSPGSTLKPFIYALALDQGLIHPLTILKDVPHSFGSYNPENFDNDFMGPISAQDALILSRNIPAIDLENQLSSHNLFWLLETAQVSQLKSASYYGLALSLGGAELTMRELSSLYAILANQGVWYPLRMRQNDSHPVGKRLFSAEASFLIMNILKKTHKPDNSIGQLPVAWKTGTSSGYRDAWTVGIFGPYVLTVWLGNFDNTSNPALIGKNLAAPLFFELISAIKQENGRIPALNIDPKQLNITQVEICKASGLLPTPFCKNRNYTDFIPGVSPIKTDTIFREIAINPKTGLRTCHINKDTQFAIYEFWSSDLLKIFKKAHITPKIPPFFEEGCISKSTINLAPQISSPKKELTYIVRADNPDNNNIPFIAVTDAGVKTLYWFLNDRFITKTLASKPFFWKAKAGDYLVRVVDDQGFSDVRMLHVHVEK